MKYLCLIYADRNESHEAFDSERLACADGLEATGEYRAAEAHQCLPTLTRPRVRKSISDGPFIETKE